jgi:hypothetical protein
MKLEHYQKKLAGLIRGTYGVKESDHVHLHAIADSINLQVTQEVISEWRMLSIENYCRLTAGVLKQLDLFREETENFISAYGFSPYVEELGQAFLLAMEQHDIDLLASVAAFERAMIDVQQGLRDDVTVKWHYNPYEVLAALFEGSGLAELEAGEEYAAYIASDLPDLFRVTRLQ